MQELLLHCIHITKHRGVLYTEHDLKKAKEYVENQLSFSEIDFIQKVLMGADFDLSQIDISKLSNKLLKQKEMMSK